jgi:hypothetical protein
VLKRRIEVLVRREKEPVILTFPWVIMPVRTSRRHGWGASGVRKGHQKARMVGLGRRAERKKRPRGTGFCVN